MVNIVDLNNGRRQDDGSIIYDVLVPKPLFSKVIRNNATRALDGVFDLRGIELAKGSEAARYLMNSVGYSSLGDSRIERVMSYFAGFARVQGMFFGLGEDEIIKNIGAGTFTAFSEDEFRATLGYRDPQNEGAIYLGRSVCEGIGFVFPQNVRKNFFA